MPRRRGLFLQRIETPKWLTDLVLGEPGQRKGTPAQRGGWREGMVEAYTETASGDSLLLLSAMNLRYWEMKEDGTEQNDMGTNYSQKRAMPHLQSHGC